MKMRYLVKKSCKTEVSISGQSTLVKNSFSEQFFLPFSAFFPVIRAGCHVSQMADSSITEMELFDTSPGSAVEEEAEQIPKERTSKKSRGAPAERIRLSQQEKMKLVQYHLANPQHSQKTLIDWCFTKFEMKKRLSVGAMCNLLKPDNVKRFMKMHENETNAYVLSRKSSKGGLFPDLETELFSWFRHNETKHAALTDDIVREKAKSIAAKLKISKFEASPHWIQRFKKRHGVSQIVLHGEAGSADKIYIEAVRAVLLKLLSEISRTLAEQT